MKNLLKYDIILQNCSTKQVKIYKRRENISDDPLYLSFDLDFEGVVDGEYNYYVFVDMREDVEFELKANILSTILHTEEGDVRLKDLKPIVGLMKIDKEIDNKPIYFENKIEYLYL